MTDRLVGRDHDLGVLRRALEDATAGTGSLVLVTGPAGIGKTRLCDELLVEARRDGFTVAWAACWEDARTGALAPWRSLVQQLGLDVPDAPPSGDVAVARTRLFEAVVADLRRVAAATGRLLLVIDDLQWADATSLALARHLVGPVRAMPLLLVATVRTRFDGGLPAPSLDLARQARVVPLGGLEVGAVAELVAGVTDRVVPADVAATLHAHTGGNPLFARELARSLDAGDDLARARLPPTVRDVLGRILDGLSGRSRAIVDIAAIAGDDATTELARAVTGLPAAEVLAVAAEAVDAGVLGEPASGRLALTHPLLRAAAIDRLAAPARIDLHRRVGLALARHPSSATPAALAHHFLAAAPGGGVARAVEHARLAAGAASRMFAFDEAAELLARALAALDLDPGAGDRAGLLVELGEARSWANDVDGARAALLEGAALARDAGRADLLARAALGIAGRGGFEVPLFDRAQLSLLEDALDALGDDGDRALRAECAARLSVALSLGGRDDRRAELARQAVDLAREAGDDRALANALAARCDVHAGPAHVDDRAGDATEIVAIGLRLRDPAIELLGRRLRVVALLEQGDIAGADTEIEAFARTAAPLDRPQFDWILALWRAARAVHDRDHAGFVRWNDEVARRGALAGSRNAEVLAFGQRWMALIELGRVDDAVRHWHDAQPSDVLADYGPVIAASQAWATAIEGDREQASSLIDRHTPALLTMIDDSEWLSSLTQLADAIALLGGHPLAASIRDELARHRDRWVIDGTGAFIRGPVTRWLDLLAPLAGAVAEPAPGTGRFVREGDLWSLTFEGTTAHVKHGKGVRDLAVLLAHPGAEVAAVDLVADGGGALVEHDTGEVLDERARRAYRARIDALRLELDDADVAGDPARSAQAQHEFAALTAQLAGALGLGGRARRSGGSGERARTAVTARIRDALGRIDRVHPALGNHLRRSIRTGTFCCYDPDPPVGWEL